jgi:hypothetical protein
MANPQRQFMPHVPWEGRYAATDQLYHFRKQGVELVIHARNVGYGIQVWTKRNGTTWEMRTFYEAEAMSEYLTQVRQRYLDEGWKPLPT